MINLMENNKKRYLIAGLALSGLMLTSYLAIFVVPRVLVTFSKAAPMTKVSLANSYVLGAKMLAKADGIDACKINVFVLDPNGRGVVDKRVVLEGVEGIKALSLKTDGDGKVAFEITSKVEGQFPITALIEGVSLPKQVTVTFRNSD